MSSIIYNKLVRDKIPDIIERSGKIAITEILSEEQYIKMLDKKLIEELDEYQNSKDVEELADLLEVLFTIVEAKGIHITEFEQIRKEKEDKRGGFKQKILLKKVVDK